MDKEQEQLEFLGFIGVLKHSFKIILSNPKIFSKISLEFILPLTLIALVNNEISKLFSSKWGSYWGFEAVYFVLIFAVIFSLLSISAVVYTVACIYTGKDVTFKQVMMAVPKVWKKLVITLISNFCIVLAYAFAIVFCSGLILLIYGISSKQSDTQVTFMIIATIICILSSPGLIYISIFWQLANVISVMENSCGFKAMKKSKTLITGKLGTAIAIMLVLSLCYVPILSLNQVLQTDTNIGIGPKIVCILLILVLNPLLTLYSLVVQTVFYCVCKSYHHESIDKFILADHLEAFRGNYVPLLTETVEIV